jgi:hypothetical protein
VMVVGFCFSVAFFAVVVQKSHPIIHEGMNIIGKWCDYDSIKSRIPTKYGRYRAND